MLGVTALMGSALYSRLALKPRNEVAQEEYYRAVYVLQSLGGPAAEEEEVIPPRVPYLDETESLLHHPDKILVLQQVADMLAAADGSRPRAPLFEAYARLALGERERAAALLTRYVIESEYSARHYSLLCENLYSLQDNTSLLLICREWAERDSICLENRAYYLWAVLHNLGRHADAARSAEKDAGCLGWRAGVYAAKSRHALGEAAQAEQLVQKTVARFPNDGLQIRRLWEQLKDRETV